MHKLKNFLHHYLYPHESNNYRAKALHHTSITFYIILILCIQLSVGILRRSGSILGFATDITVEKVMVLVNQKRAENNLPPLSLSSELSTAATNKASDMFGNNYWAHVSPTGTTPWTFITSSGYQYVYAGENLAKDFDKTDDMVDAWMNSPTHRANILKPEYTDIGLSVMNGRLNGVDTTLVVQEFGSKAANNDRIHIANTKKTEASSNPQDASPPAAIGVVGKRGSILSADITKTASLVLTEFLLIVLFLDSLYMWKFKPLRISGHSLAHIIFLGALIGAMGATGIGVIL